SDSKCSPTSVHRSTCTRLKAPTDPVSMRHQAQGVRDDGDMELERAASDFVTRLQVERGLSPNTARSYRTDLESLVAFAEARGVRHIADVDLELLRDWLWQASQAGLAKSTLACRTAAVRSFTDWAVHTGILTADVAT